MGQRRSCALGWYRPIYNVGVSRDIGRRVLFRRSFLNFTHPAFLQMCPLAAVLVFNLGSHPRPNKRDIHVC